MKIYRVIILLFALSCQSKEEHPSSVGKAVERKEKMYKFYGFDFEFTMYLEPVGVSEKFILKNHSTYPSHSHTFKKNRLYYIKFANEEHRMLLSKPDTISVELNTTQLDSLYSVASKYFQLEYKTNVSTYDIPPPPMGDNEWAYAQITLDLGYWGNKHSVITATYVNLYQFLLRLKNKSH